MMIIPYREAPALYEELHDSSLFPPSLLGERVRVRGM
jgi:hypothetical protein